MNVNIAYSSSDAYAKCTGVSILSLFKNNKDIENLTIYLFSMDISDDNKKMIDSIAKKYKRDVIFIEISDKMNVIAEQFNLKAMRGGYNTYIRLFVSKWLNNVNRILFIDSDTLVVGSVRELFLTPMDGYLIAAVPEVGVYGIYNFGDDPEIINGCDKYVNAGVMLINLELWRSEEANSYIAKKISEYKKDWCCSDQSIFNFTINSRCKYIHLKNNYYSLFHYVSYGIISKIYNISRIFTPEECEEATKEPTILHFIGLPYSRPWYQNNVSPYKDLYMEYYNKSPWAGVTLQKIPKNPQIVYRIYDYFLYITRKHNMQRTHNLIMSVTQGGLKKYLKKYAGKRK